MTSHYHGIIDWSFVPPLTAGPVNQTCGECFDLTQTQCRSLHSMQLDACVHYTLRTALAHVTLS